MSTDLDVPGLIAPLRAGKILCIGRNYAAHAAEMRSAVPESPMMFLKPASAIIRSGGQIVIPDRSNDVHYEVELVALIGLEGKNIDEESALEHVAGFAVGLDMTARDIQAVAKEKGHPWSVSKGFDTFAPLGAFSPVTDVADPQDLEVRLDINGSLRQRGQTADMIFSVAHLVAWCSTVMSLEAGDLIYTGTPDGVGPVQRGDILQANISGLPPLTVTVA